MKTGDKDVIVSILKRAVSDMEAGYQPEFLVFMYPRADEPIVDRVCGYNRDDSKKVKKLVNNLEGLIEQIEEGSSRQERKAAAEKPKKCSICAGLYTGLGNNAQPINAGRCCNECNTFVVVPTRIRGMVARSEAADEQDA